MKNKRQFTAEQQRVILKMRKQGSIVSEIQQHLHCRRIDLIEFLKENGLGGSLVKSFRAREFADEIQGLIKAGFTREQIAKELGLTRLGLSAKAASYKVKLPR